MQAIDNIALAPNFPPKQLLSNNKLWQQYSESIKLFKFVLLITQSTANVERGFLALSLSHITKRNYTAVDSLDCSMRTVRNLLDLYGNSWLIIS